jgi:hypothetical protein
MTPAELFEDNYPNASPKCKPWHRATYVDAKDNAALFDYYPAVVDEVNALDRDFTFVDNKLLYLTEVILMPKCTQKNTLRKMLLKFTRLTKERADIEYTMEWRRRHTGHYMHNSDPNKAPPGVFFVTKHGREDDDLTEDDRIFLDLYRTTEDAWTARQVVPLRVWRKY